MKKAKAPSPQTTLIILLGASEWPYAPDFQQSEAFSNSAHGIKDYFLKPRGFGLPSKNLLDLFDSNLSPDDIDKEIEVFLDKRIREMQKSYAARDVLVYFVGHGGFSGNDFDYYLAIRRTRIANPAASSIRILTLAHTLKEKARHLRRTIILDCCFAASATRFFQNSEPTQVAIAQTVDAFKEIDKAVGFPGKGTSLLCSSRHNVPSLISPDGKYTMFSQALLDVFRKGNPHTQTRLSLRTVARLAEDFLFTIYGDDGTPRPEVHSPDQSEGDVADVPFFPNPVIATAKNINIDNLPQPNNIAEEDSLQKSFTVQDQLDQSKQSAQKGARQQEPLKIELMECRAMVSQIEGLFDTVSLRELTYMSVDIFEKDLRHVIQVIRDMPTDVVFNFFVTRDGILANLREACNQLNIASDLLREKRIKTNQFYRSIGTCRERLEQALKYWTPLL